MSVSNRKYLPSFIARVEYLCTCKIFLKDRAIQVFTGRVGQRHEHQYHNIRQNYVVTVIRVCDPEVGSKIVSHTWNGFGRRSSGAKALRLVKVAGAEHISEAKQGLGSAPKGFSCRQVHPPCPGITQSVN